MSYNFSISYTTIIDFKPDYETDKIAVKTFQKDNLLELSKKNASICDIYKQLIEHDFLLYFHEKGHSFFCKRSLFQHLWQRKDLLKEGDLFYTLDQQLENKVTTLQRPKLLVIFSCMPTAEKYSSPIVTDRCFVPFFPSIARSLVKDILIMRVMDLNVSHGSHYIATKNYPEMENDIQRAIKKVMCHFAIAKEDVVLYGVSKGGTGALYHGSIADYKVLAIDPIISLEEYNQQGNHHFLEDFRTVDLTFDLNQNLVRCSKKKFILSNENSEFNFRKIKGLAAHKIQLIAVKDNTINHHHEVSKNTIPEQLSLLNGLFSEDFSIY